MTKNCWSCKHWDHKHKIPVWYIGKKDLFSATCKHFNGEYYCRSSFNTDGINCKAYDERKE